MPMEVSVLAEHMLTHQQLMQVAGRCQSEQAKRKMQKCNFLKLLFTERGHHN